MSMCWMTSQRQSPSESWQGAWEEPISFLSHTEALQDQLKQKENYTPYIVNVWRTLDQILKKSSLKISWIYGTQVTSDNILNMPKETY